MRRNTQVTNGAVDSNSLAARINAAKTPTDIDSVVSELRDMADGLRDDLQQFASKVREVSSDQLAALVGRIFVFDNVPARFGGKLEDLPSLRFLSDLQREAVFDNAAGWVRRFVLSAATGGKPALINRDAFDHQLRSLFRRVSVAPLAVVFETPDSAVDPVNYQSYGFFQQLDWIDTDFDFVRDCVIHYVHARVARVKWTDTDAVSEAELRVYEDDLKMKWKLQVRRESSRRYASSIVQGQERLTETLAADSILNGQLMPKSITCGSLHALADFDAESDPEIGWHPDFMKMVKAAKDKS